MCCASLDVFRGVGRFCPVSTFWRIGHVCSTYWPVFSVARTCCDSLDVFRGVGRFCPVSTFWDSVHVSARYWPVFTVARTCCASRTFSTESGGFARFPRFGVLAMFVQRIGQFSASRARAALVRSFPWSPAFFPGFHALAFGPCFCNVLASFQRRAPCCASLDVCRGVGRFCPISTFG